MMGILKNANRGAIARSSGWLLVLAVCGCSRVRLDLDPAVMEGCALGHGQAVDVSWDASSTPAKRVSISLRRPGSMREHQWIRGKTKGERKTGRWVTDGLTFVLRDQDGRKLAMETVETARCPLKQKDE